MKSFHSFAKQGAKNAKAGARKRSLHREGARSVLCIEGHRDACTDMIEKYHLTKDQQAILEQRIGSEDWSGTVVNPVGGMKVPVLYQYNY